MRFLPPAAPAMIAAVGALLLAGCTEISNPFKQSPPPPAVVASATKVDAGKVPGNNSIPVVVDDHPITSYDIAQRAKLMQISGATGGDKQAESDLIDETLELEEAAKFQISVPPDQVNSAYAGIAQNLKLSADGLTQALGGEGIDANTLKRRLLAEITWQQLVVKRAQDTGQIKEQDVTNALLAKNPSTLTTKEYTLQQIVFVVPSGSPASAYDQRTREAEAFRERFQGCDKTLDQAKQLTGVVVKDIERRDATDLSGAEADEIKTIKDDGTLRPDRIDEGIEVVAVCGVKDIQSTDAARLDIENTLFQKQAGDIAKTYLQELHDQATIVYR